MLLAFHLLELVALAAIAGFDDQMFFTLDLLELLFLDDHVPFVADPLKGILFNPDVLIAFGVQKNLFLALFVLEPEFVEPATALARQALEGGHGFVIGQGVGWHVDAVVNPAGNNRLIRIAFQKIHDHFMADTGQVQRAPLLPGPALRYPNPAGTVRVGFAIAIPVKLTFHPAVLIGINLLALGTDDNSGLRSLHDWLGRDARRPVGLLGLDGDDLAQIRLAGNRPARKGFIFVRLQPMRRRHDQIFPVLLVARALGQTEQIAYRQSGGVASPLRDLVLRQ